MKKTSIVLMVLAFCTTIALFGSDKHLTYNHAIHSQLQGEERMKVANQLIQVDTKIKKMYYPDPDKVFLAPGGSLKTIGLVMFDADIMNAHGGKTPSCCANLYPLPAVQQILSERMLESWEKALTKFATSGITLIPTDKIAKSASYQKNGKAVKDFPNDKETSVFQKMDQALGFENVKYSFWAVPGGKKAPDTGLAIPRGLRSFSVNAGTGATAFLRGNGAPIKEIGLENGLDVAILVNSTFTWESDPKQSISTNLKGTAKMTISASLNVPNGRWEEAVKATKQKTVGVAMNPAFRAYSITFEDKVSIPYDPAAQQANAKCCRDGLGDEADRDLFIPMLAEYDQVVDMMVMKMVADLRSTH